MCGIVGILSFREPVDRSRLERLIDGVAHRGPDDRGCYVAPNARCGLGHSRLAVIDLTQSAHQPMVHREHQIVIVFNGEIYNFLELRKQCEITGYRFRSNSDTEVILALYLEHGTSCLSYLRGMFAFALWDERRERLFFARDRVGKKPFNYSLSRHGFVFSSEIDPLARHHWVDRGLDLRSLDFYLQNMAVPSPRSIYKGIRKLPPAHFGIVENGRLTIERYWKLDYQGKEDLADDEALDAFEEKLTESVRLRTMADVPVGALLSGGVDSSLVVALMTKLRTDMPRTFSVGFSEEAFDESTYAMTASGICRTLHRPVDMQTPDLDGLPTLVRRYGEPFADYSALPSFAVCKAARAEVSVVLNGDGGDELLGGYPRYSMTGMQLLMHRVQRRLPIPLSTQVKWLLGTTAFPFRKIHRLFLAYAVADAAPVTMYHGVGSDWDRRALLDYEGGETNLMTWRTDWLAQARAETSNPIDSMLWLDNQTYLPDVLLVKMDIASMHCGLEARSPFLDHELIEFCASLPTRFKVRHGVGKYLIKRLAERYFPHEFVHRRKMGFGIPLHAWLKGPMHHCVRDVLLDPESMEPLDHGQVTRHFDRFEKGAYGADPIGIWILLMYGLWHRHCYLS